MPDDRVDELYEFVASLNKPEPSEPPAAADLRQVWTPELVAAAVAKDSQHRPFEAEEALIRRIAEAEGRRVPLSEISRDLGLPSMPALEQDFTCLLAFCRTAAGDPHPLPVLEGESDDGGWYWMDPVIGARFLHVLDLPAQPAS